MSGEPDKARHLRTRLRQLSLWPQIGSAIIPSSDRRPTSWGAPVADDGFPVHNFLQHRFGQRDDRRAAHHSWGARARPQTSASVTFDNNGEHFGPTSAKKTVPYKSRQQSFSFTEPTPGQSAASGNPRIWRRASSGQKRQEQLREVLRHGERRDIAG
jgi:hypothetical protein